MTKPVTLVLPNGRRFFPGSNKERKEAKKKLKKLQKMKKKQKNSDS